MPLAFQYVFKLDTNAIGSKKFLLVGASTSNLLEALAYASYTVTSWI
jgi:hypothetical protein